MKKKFFLLSTIISSCILTIASNQTTADEMRPGMPSKPCYPASRCTGNPNLIGGNCYSSTAPANSGVGSPTTKVLQTESTEKFEGTVKSVNKVSLPNQTQIQVVLNTNSGDVLVILGPANFMDQAKVKLQAGDKITVKGYRIKANGNHVILAAEVKKNGYTLQLLNENRQPLWGGNNSPQNSSSAPYSGSQNSYMQRNRY